MTGNFRSRDIEQSTMPSSSAIDDLIEKIAIKLDYGDVDDIKVEIEELIRCEKQAAYSKGASDMAEKVKAALKNKMLELGGNNCNFLRDERMFGVIDELLSENKQGAVAEK